MIDRTLFVFHAGTAYPRLERWALGHSRSVLSQPILKLAKILEYRRTPRSQGYMERLAQRAFPDFDRRQLVVVGDDRQLGALDWTALQRVVLLWPDANGTGWSGIVRQVFRRKRPHTGVIVLNGRQRLFMLNRLEWRSFTWRRALEQTLALELAFVLAFVLITPWLMLWDLLRARR